uniref:Reverse transcriptase domain-containing protein n=1 Tax=Parastrongyloides trichosuri TaxID=131310 RepID=A0A0N4Z8L5_PARTI
MGWLDFSKAFDTVNHLSLRLIASKLNISEQMRKLMVSLYGNWSTRFCVGGVFSRIVNLNRGSPQGDCLSPTMFCIAMAYISSKLNLLPTIHNQHGSSNFEKFPKLKRMRNHIAYIDDLKVYASSESILQDLVKEVMRAGSVLSLELNLKKCSHVSSREGILETVDDENDEVENGILNNIPYLMPDEDPYKYLGICQRIFDDREISLTKTKERILERVKEIWSLDLNVSQLIQAHNSIIPAIAGYVAGNIKSEGKMNSVLRYVEDEIDREVLSTIRELGLLQSNNCVARCYLDQDKGGLGIKNLRCEAEIAIGMNLSYNLMNRRNLPEILMHRSLDSFKRRNAFSDLSKIINIGAPVKVKSITPHIQEAYKEPTKYPDVPITIKYTDDSREVFFNYKDLQKKIKTLINSYYQNLFYEKFARKLKFPKFLDEMDKKQEKVLHMWLKAGISIEVCRRNLSAQEDQSTLKAHPSRIGLDDRCRFGCPAPETVCHILNECEYFKSGLMRRRHDSIAQIVTRFVLKKYNYDYKNEKIGENDLMRFTYDQPVPVSKMEDEPFPNKPDLVIWEKDKKRILIIEFANHKIIVNFYASMSERLRRVIRNHLGFARAGSNPAGCE